MRLQKEDIVLAWASLFKLFDPFNDSLQRQALRESVAHTFQLRDYDDKEVEQQDDSSILDKELDDDEAKDELDVMKQISTGTRRSTRVKAQPRQSGSYMTSTEQIQIDDDY